MQDQRRRRPRPGAEVQLVEVSRRPPNRHHRERLQIAAVWLGVVLACAAIGYLAMHWQLDLAFVIAVPFGL